MPIMKKQLTVFTLAALLFCTAYAPVVHAQPVTSVSEAVTRIDAMIAEMTVLKLQLEKLSLTYAANANTPVSQVQGAQASAILTLRLDYGVTNDDIAKVQRLLATDADSVNVI